MLQEPAFHSESYSLSSTSGNTYRLNCLVLGDVLNHVFLVKIASIEAVFMLEEVIGGQKQYSFPAHQLNLYRTSEKWHAGMVVIMMMTG